jgi:integrase
MGKKLTQRTIPTLEASERGKWHADAELPGFYAVCYPHATVFFARFRVGNRRRVVKIGRYGTLTPDQAREQARKVLGHAALGGDPAADRERTRKMPSFEEWKKSYLEHVRLTKKSPREDVRFLGMTALRWGPRALDAIDPEDVEAFRRNLSKTKTQANRWLASVRSCFAAAVRAGLLRSNPAAGLKPYRENPPRARVLSADELERFLAALHAEADPHARAAFHMLVETGARLSEVLHAKWEDVDFESGTWRIPSPKAGHPQTVPVTASTTKMLKKLPQVGAFIIAGRKKNRPRFDLKKPWERLVAAAKLEGVHIHDLRRTFGLAVAKSAGLHVASKLLRHADVRVTERVYAPLGIEDLRAAVEHRASVLPFGEKKGESA